MTTGEFLTRATIWAALAAGTVALLLPAAECRTKTARIWWTAGAACFAAHVALAFGAFHGWSHAHAWAETARQTELATGVRSGFGLYLNYLFGLAWLGDCLWWWLASDRWANRPRWITYAWWGFFLFMLFNGTVAFGRGPVRWFGAAICLALLLRTTPIWRRRPQPSRRDAV